MTFEVRDVVATDFQMKSDEIRHEGETETVSQVRSGTEERHKIK